MDINSKNLKKVDMVFLATDHDSFDYELIAKSAKLIIDSRHKFKKTKNVYYT